MMSAIPLFKNNNRVVDEEYTVFLDEHFDYRSIHTFRRSCPKEILSGMKVTIDMQATRYIDSSGVALLVSLYHQIRTEGVCVNVINCRPEVKRILSICHLEDKFTFCDE